jgi:subtilase family serine protease
MKLGVMGITLVAASGDDGANSRSARANRGGYLFIYIHIYKYV